MANPETNIHILTPEDINTIVEEAVTYKNTIEQLNNQLDPILEQFKNDYVNFHMNPENNEYEQIFQTSNYNIQNLNTTFFSINNAIREKNQNLDKNMMQINEMIQQAKNENNYLNKKYDRSGSKQKNSIGMVNEYNQIYNRDYSYNVHLFLGIIISLYITIRMFSNGTINSYHE